MTTVAAIRAELPRVLALALPIVAGLAASTLIGVTDALMLAPLGPVPLAAVGLTNAVALMVYAAVWGLLSALSVRIGAAHGAGAGRAIPTILRGGLVLGALSGAAGALAMGAVWPLLPLARQPDEVLAALPAYWALIAAFMLPYALLTVFKAAFEAVGRPWLGTGFAFLAVVVNVPLNYALIYGLGPLPAFGLTGAGMASFAAETVAMAAAWGWWARARSMRRLRLRHPVRTADIAATAREGAPMGLMYLAETAALTVATLIIGTFGTVALAANQVASVVGGLLYMLPFGIAGAVAILVAQGTGAGAGRRVRPVVFAGLTLATAWLGLAALLLLVFGRAIAGAIVHDPQVAVLAASILSVFALMQVFDGVQSTMVGALRGLSDAGYAAGVSMVAFWVVGLPLGWAFAHPLGFGPPGVWLGWLVALMGAGAVLLRRFHAQTA